MSTPESKDIISLVRELQRHPITALERKQRTARLKRNAEAIAQALLECVEALKKGEKLIESEERIDALTAYRSLASIIETALSRLRSPHS